jgi:hypothetical protein
MTRRRGGAQPARERDDRAPDPYRSSRYRSNSKRPDDLRWFNTQLDAKGGDRDEVWQRVWAWHDRMKPAMRARHDLYLYLACLYDDAEISGLSPAAYDKVAFEPSTLSFNVVRQIVDTFTSQLTADRPLPMPLTSGGNSRQQARAKRYGRWIDGQFDQVGVWSTRHALVRDAGLFGTGLAYNFRVGKELFHDRVFPWEVGVDAREAMYGKPRNLQLTRYVDRLVLAERFPDYVEKIFEAEAGSDVGENGLETSDLVKVLVTWHLPSGKVTDGKLASGAECDGRVSICISNECLEYLPWTRPYFPFSRFLLQEPLMGWFGSGLGRQLMGLQYTINDRAMSVQRRHELSGGFVVVDDEAEVVTDHIGNDDRVILRVKGGKRPEWINPQPVHPDEWNWVLSLLPISYDITGVSRTSATGQKPAGITAARALQHLSDEQEGRFKVAKDRDEQYLIDTAWQLFDLSEDAEQDTTAPGELRVKSVSKQYGSRSADDLEWREVRLDRDSFVLQVFPTSMLPKTPGARIDYVQSLANAGWLSPDEAKMLLDFPDLERVNNLSQASYHLVQKLIDAMLGAEKPETYKYVPPDPAINLELCVVQGQQAYLNAKVDGAEPGNLGLLRRWILDGLRMQRRRAATQAAAASGGVSGAAAVVPPADPAMAPAVAPIPGDVPPPTIDGPPPVAPPPPTDVAA